MANGFVILDTPCINFNLAVCIDFQARTLRVYASRVRDPGTPVKLMHHSCDMTSTSAPPLGILTVELP